MGLLLLFIRSLMNRINDNLWLSHRRWIKRGSSPANIQGQSRVIHNRSVPTVTTQVLRGPHKDAIYRTWLDTKCTEHTLRIVNCVTGNFKAFTDSDLFLPDINAVHRTGLSTCVTRNTGRQIKTMKTTVTCRNGNRFLMLLVLLGESTTIGIIGLTPIP